MEYSARELKCDREPHAYGLELEALTDAYSLAWDDRHDPSGDRHDDDLHLICIHKNGARQGTLLIQHVEGWRRRHGPTASPVPAGTRCREEGTLPPTSRTHHGAPAQDRRVANDTADGDAFKRGAGTEAKVDVGAIVHDAGWLQGVRDNGQRTGAIGQQAHAIVPHRQWPALERGAGSGLKAQADLIVLDDKLTTSHRTRVCDEGSIVGQDADAVVGGLDRGGGEHGEFPAQQDDAHTVAVNGQGAARR